VNGIDVGDFGSTYDGGDIEIAFGCAGRADTDCLIGLVEVCGVSVGLGIDGDGLDSHLVTGADDAKCNFAAICYENS